MYHVPMYHVGNLASFARETAKRKQGEFLQRRGFGSGKVLDKLSRLAGFAKFFRMMNVCGDFLRVLIMIDRLLS